MLKQLKRFLPIWLVIMTMVGGLMSPLTAYAGDEGGGGSVFSRDADHSGAVFINAFPQPASVSISAFSDGTATKNKLFAQDTMKSAEFETTGVVFANSSYNWNKTIIDAVGAGEGDFPSTGFPISGTTFSNDGQDFEGIAESNKWAPNGAILDSFGAFFNTQSRILTMTVPGWTAGNDVWSAEPASSLYPRSERREFVSISSDAPAAAASIIENLVGGYNQALQYFDSYVVTTDGTKASYDTRGLLNMMAHIANGELPKAGSQVRYDPVTATFTPEGGWADVKLIGNPEIKSEAGSGVEGDQGEPASSADIENVKGDGIPLVYLEVDGNPGNDDKKVDTTQRFVYMVSKAPSITRNSVQGEGDVFALSFMDILTSMAGGVYIGEGVAADTSSNTSVVGDQINGLLYDTVTGFLSIFGIRSADDLVFGNDGNLFRNNAFYVYMAIVAPFVIIAIMLLFTSIVETFRKSQLQYLNTQQVGDVQNSLGNILNALLQIALLPTVVRIFVYFDQVVVEVAISLHRMLNQLIGYQNTGRTGFFGSVGDFLGSGVMNILSIILIAGLHVKFTWRYIARAISFAIYFAIAPVQFALDSFSGNGQILQMGRKSADTWKNLLSLSLMRGIDAIGIVFATTIGRLLFGSGVLVSLLGFHAVSSITDAIRNSLGLTNANIKGIAEAGEKMGNQNLRGGMRMIGAGMAGVGVGAATAMANERNLMDAQQAAKLRQEAKDKGATRRATQVSGGPGGAEGQLQAAGAGSGTGSGTNTSLFNEELALEQQRGGDNQRVQTGDSPQGSTPSESTSFETDSNTGGSPSQVSLIEQQPLGGQIAVSESGQLYNPETGEVSDQGEMFLDRDGNPTDDPNEAVYTSAGWDEMNVETNRDGRGGRHRIAHPDWSIENQDYSHAISQMNVDPSEGRNQPFNYGLDPSDEGARIDPVYSQEYYERRGPFGLGGLKKKQNINTEYGMSINKNVDYNGMKFGRTRAMLDRARAGYISGTRTGISYDPDTIKTLEGTGYQNKMKYSGSDHYGVNREGRIIAKTGRAKAERAGRMAAAAVGGVASAFSPKNLAASALAGGAAWAAALSDNKIDDALVAATYAKHLESRRTGDHKGVIHSLASSMPARIAGINPDKFTASQITTTQGAPKRKGEPNTVLNTQSMYQRQDQNDIQAAQSAMVLTGDGRARRVRNLTPTPTGSKMMDDIGNINKHVSTEEGGLNYRNGSTNISSDQLRSIATNTSDASVKRSAHNLMDHMESHGLSELVHDHNRNELASKEDFELKKSYDADAVSQDQGLSTHKDFIQRNPQNNGFSELENEGGAYHLDSETGGMQEYSESNEVADKRVSAQARIATREGLEELGTVEANQLIDDMYAASDPNDVNEAHTKAADYLEAQTTGGIPSQADASEGASVESSTPASQTGGTSVLDEKMSGGQTAPQTESDPSNNTVDVEVSQTSQGSTGVDTPRTENPSQTQSEQPSTTTQSTVGSSQPAEEQNSQPRTEKNSQARTEQRSQPSSPQNQSRQQSEQTNAQPEQTQSQPTPPQPEQNISQQNQQRQRAQPQPEQKTRTETSQTPLKGGRSGDGNVKVNTPSGNNSKPPKEQPVRTPNKNKPTAEDVVRQQSEMIKQKEAEGNTTDVDIRSGTNARRREQNRR